MRTMFKRSPSSYIPDYNNNAVIRLIIVSGSVFVLYKFIWATMMVMGFGDAMFQTYWMPNVALPAVALLKYKFWTVLTYGWFHNGFWELFSNMLWLYCFGSLVQMLIGHRQVIPIFVYSLVAGGIVYWLVQLLPGNPFTAPAYIMGPRAGLVGFAAAAITLSPTYRFYLTPTFSVPILVVAGIFSFLMILNSGFNIPVLLMMVAGGLTGFGYVKMLRSGYKPGDWAYTILGNIEKLATPNEQAIRAKRSAQKSATKAGGRQSITQKRIDDILDKINQKGYRSLTQEEKEILMHAGKENS